jgi:Uma2 family endonuclease
MDVKVKGRHVYYYPDVMLSCEPQTDACVETAPCLIAEVLSPATEVIDRGEKLHHYQQIASLQAYLLVAHDQRRIEVYRRSGEWWTYQSISDERPIELPGLDEPTTLGEIYQGLDFDDVPLRAGAEIPAE